MGGLKISAVGVEGCDDRVGTALVRARAAMQEEIDLLVFPELYPFPLFPASRDKSLMFTAAEVYPYASVEAVRPLCVAQAKWALVPTWIQRGENSPCNAMFVIDPAGNIVTEYRQQHVAEGSDWHGTLFFAPVTGEAPVVPISGVSVGLLLGHDLYDPGLAAGLAARGAQVIVVPAATVDERHEAQLEVLARAAAITHGIPVLVALRTGQILFATSDGEVLRCGDPGGTVSICTVDQPTDTRLFSRWEVTLPRSPETATAVEEVRRASYVYSPLLLGHETNLEPERYEIPERPERLDLTMSLLREAGVTDALKCVRPRPAGPEELALAHDPGYIAAVAVHAEDGLGFHGLYSPFGPGSYEVARLAAGAVIEAAYSVLAGGYQRAPASVVLARPPGHHAETRRGMGYCIFNNVAVGTRWVQRYRSAIHPRIDRVMILDWDVHHGNGTQEIFYRDPSVLFCSLHQWPEYPGLGPLDDIGEGEGTGYNINLPLPAGSGDSTYLRAFEEIILPIADQFRPDLVVVSAGQDCHHADPISDMRVTVEGFRAMARTAKEIAEQHASGRLVVALEGGYNLHTLPYLVLAIVDEIAGLGIDVREPVALDPRPEPSEAADVLRAARRALTPYWTFS